jgi:polygalacturonase
MTTRTFTCLSLALAIAASAFGPAARAADRVAGTITRTYTIVEDTDLTGDVTCQVADGTACFAFGAPGVELRLNGFTVTGKADPTTGCGGVLITGENGISTAGQAGVSIHGPGLVQRFRIHGVAVLGSSDVRIDGITASTNCGAGVFVNALSFGTIVEGVTSLRNGSTSAGASCGGI